MKEYKVLGVKVQTLEEYEAKKTLHSFLNSKTCHHIVTVNPEFVVATRKNKQFLEVINNASLATIDGNGIIKALQFWGHDISMDNRLTGVDLTAMLINIARKDNYKILFCLNSKGLSKLDSFFIKIKDDYPDLDFQVADEHTVLAKADIFKPHIILVGYGAPQQDLWIWQNLKKMSSVKVAVGVGGSLDFLVGSQKRAPKIFASLGLEWLWRLISRPNRIRRIYRAIIIFPYLVIKYKHGK